MLDQVTDKTQADIIRAAAEAAVQAALISAGYQPDASGRVQGKVISPDAMFPRREMARKLTEEGYPTAEATLATKACRGGGPPYATFGGRAIYRWGPALAWAQSRTSPPRCNTSEHRVEPAANPASKSGRTASIVSVYSAV